MTEGDFEVSLKKRKTVAVTTAAVDVRQGPESQLEL